LVRWPILTIYQIVRKFDVLLPPAFGRSAPSALYDANEGCRNICQSRWQSGTINWILRMLGPQPSRWHRCTSFTVTDSRSSYENVAAAEEEDWKARGRLRAALRGFREVDAQMLELVLWGLR